ncbi:bacillithiol biosynthesis cysteine-adding enzyme BshC [Peribacillus cavernae]|uniref:Putative cysteine ligase BshC n=1 Tax=Peribacillus cavernae TaxID=1674310 RepID=A0A433HPS1_9BACI|nr:bacillithiol biosynthesis cysteine-adding enzyme BshC [Peribacillus cavernae]MDQ0217183.1 bacillithiol biosynthesis cysteine-adding enzyme BshC [Peribacillus cavernae]RUQ30346.1 bacillithiol biosynthesis cysteine-adding enzyme BshC [Peribacillus cavernae]
MEIKNLALPSLNQFASDYIQGNLQAEDYFHYNLPSSDLYQARYRELMTRSFLRDELADYIQNYMARFTPGSEVLKNIADLRKSDSAVVIGGQQAGLLAGPMYTIHKVISIIKLAEQQEKALGKRVIPVFWIAGEDHDLAEVNHVYTMKDGKPEKKSYPLYHPYKTMITDMKLDADIAMAWIEEIVETYGESEFTNMLLDRTKSHLETGETFADFFASLIHEWFNQYGLLLLDAGDPALRNIEAGYFIKLIEHSGKVTDAVLSQQAFMQEKGYKRTIEMGENAANLFHYNREKQERTLLERSGTKYHGKNGDVSFTEAELIDIAKNQPENLSNNVVTRPIMQEMLFPVLAFISGPGEIAYWAELKQAFEQFGLKMPPIIPRLNITILERSIATDLADAGLDLETVLTAGVQQAEKSFIESVKDGSVEALFKETKALLEEKHALLSGKAVEIDKGLQPMLAKNRALLLGQLDFLYDKILKSTRDKHAVALQKFKRIETSLFPLGSPQERIWNICYYLNKYGPCFIEDIMKLDYEFDNKHKVICL